MLAAALAKTTRTDLPHHHISNVVSICQYKSKHIILANLTRSIIDYCPIGNIDVIVLLVTLLAYRQMGFR